MGHIRNYSFKYQRKAQIFGLRQERLGVANQRKRCYRQAVLHHQSQSLIRKQQLAASAGAGYNLYSMRQDLFLLDGTPAQGHTTAELEKALRDEIERLKTKPVSEQELARIKAQVVAGKTYEQDSPFYQAMQMGTLETVGLGWQRMDEYTDRVLAITAKQLQTVARKYLIDDHLSIAELKPLPLEKNTNNNQGGEQHAAH